MPILDLNSRSSYVGSYTDNYITGAFLVTRQENGQLSTNTNRGVSISKFGSGLLNSLPTSTLIKPEYYSNSFADYRTALSTSVTLISKNNKFSVAESENEYYYDSFVPDMNEIFNVDGGNLVMINVGKGFATQSIMLEYIFGGDLYSPITNTIVPNSLFSTSSTGIKQVSNDKWNTSFPFEIKYKNAERLQGKIFSPEKMYYSISGSVDTTEGSNGINFNHEEVETSKPITMLPEFLPSNPDGFWGYLPSAPYVIEYKTNIFFGFLFPSTSIQTSGLPLTTSKPIHGIFADKQNGAGTMFNTTTNIIQSASNETNIKFVYGFGDGYANRGQFITNVIHNIGIYRCESVFFGALIRGWKYGLKSGFPEKSKALLSNKAHEQLQFKHCGRLFSAMFNSKNKTITYPLKVTFLSGSSGSEINLNSTLNTRDSGVYDSFYRAGRPFFD